MQLLVAVIQAVFAGHMGHLILDVTSNTTTDHSVEGSVLIRLEIVLSNDNTLSYPMPE